MDALVKSLTPLFFLFSAKLQPSTTPYWFRINTINLCISSLLYHYSIENNVPEYLKNIFYYYDRFSISLTCSYRTFDDQTYGLLYSLITIISEYNKYISYCLGFITVVQKLSIFKNISIFISQFISFYFFYSKKNEEWTNIQKIIWHSTQSFIYIYHHYLGNKKIYLNINIIINNYLITYINGCVDKIINTIIFFIF